MAEGKQSIHIALDSHSKRSIDENGYLRVSSSHITKATVNPYYGREIPNWEENKLDPEKIYQGLRDPEELKKSLHTWAGLPLHIEHHIDSAEDPQKLTRVGTVGTEIVWNDPYIDAPLIVWDKAAIDAINDGSFRELSCAYRYDPEFKTGEYKGEKYDFIMRNIRGNHVALVEEGRAGHDVLVADNKPENLKGKNMAEENTAKDSPQDVEKAEVDLAQAIIDLHKKNPETGEIMDVTEDEEEIAKLKVILDSVEEKLPPESLKKLVEVIESLKAFVNKQGEAMDEDLKKAMDKAGCDSESEAEQKAFAEGVKYGEELIRNPEERKKIDSEHESEGMKKAMDKAGCDSESEAEQKAFAEGVKYGEEHEKAVNSDESEEEKKQTTDEESVDVLKKVIEVLPELSEEQVEKLKTAFSLGTDEELEKKADAAADRALKKRKFLGAEDAEKIRQQATKDAMKNMREIAEACRKVRPLIGEMDPMAFDSAKQVYGETLLQMGVDSKKYSVEAWKGMVDMLLESNAALRTKNAGIATDSKPIPDKGPFANLNRITLSM